MIADLLLTVAGILLLYAGAELLVRGSVALSQKLRVTPLLIGLIVIGLGTSSPELVVSIEATLIGSGEIAIGNIVGSNISNLALILGIAALSHPIRAQKALLNRELPVMIAASLLMTLLMWNGVLSRTDGILLLSGLIIYLVLTIRDNITPAIPESELAYRRFGTVMVVAATLAGLGILILGAHLMILGATGIARTFAISEGVIGLTIVAIGTSLPELATAVVAALRRQGELILGALIGSNILNILFVLGVTGTVRAVYLTDIMVEDLILMSVLALVMIPVARTGYVVSRLEGGLLLAAYCGYIAWLFLR
ncbi:MAG: calcium/sodium antiporter [Cyclonatronaceae bacterium]